MNNHGMVLEGVAVLVCVAMILIVTAQMIGLFVRDQRVLADADALSSYAIYTHELESPVHRWPCLEELDQCYSKEIKIKVVGTEMDLKEEVCIARSNICDME